MNQEPLFGGYGTPTPRRTKAVPPAQPLEPLLPGWTYVRNKSGVLPFAHLIQSQSSNGSMTTRCGKLGQQLPTEGVTVMLRCPECDMDLQLES
jgi:hypothetical protein